jgi:hypothetical protein
MHFQFKIINVIALLVISSSAFSASMMDGFIDPEDGMFDVSHYLAEKKGFLPIPIIITEPAVGYGAGVALVFLHDPLSGRAPDGDTFSPQSVDDQGKLIPPSISAVFGAYTENDTWLAGGVHMGVWNNDNIRYTGAIFTGSINMKFYREVMGVNVSADAKIEPNVLLQALKFRINDSDFFAGADYLLVDTDTEIGLSIINPDFKFKNGSREAAIGFTLDYDTRDSTFTPSDGIMASIKATLFREAIGGDTNYEKYKAKALYFTSITDDIPLGLRADFESIDGERGEIPFYAYPFISLRGIPMMRYQGDTTAVGEIELGWKFTPRWTLIGFGGVGRTEDIGQSDSSTTVYTKGAGLRYFIARRFGTHVGFDVAKGPEDTVFYLQFGHAWN